MRYGGNTTCVEIQTAQNTRIILDAGSGLRALGNSFVDKENVLSELSPIHLFLTHRHIDHVIGLPYFQPFRNPEQLVIVRCGNATVAEVHQLAATMAGPPLFVPVPTIDEVMRIEPCDTGVCVQVDAKTSVTKFEARHNGGAAVFRIDGASGSAIAFAPDNELSYASNDASVTEWRNNLAQALRDVPILIHDATYSDAELDRFVGWGHSSAEEATRFAMECGAKQLILFHHHPDRSDDHVDKMVTACRTIALRETNALEIIAAYEGMSLAL